MAYFLDKEKIYSIHSGSARKTDLYKVVDGKLVNFDIYKARIENVNGYIAATIHIGPDSSSYYVSTGISGFLTDWGDGCCDKLGYHTYKSSGDYHILTDNEWGLSASIGVYDDFDKNYYTIEYISDDFQYKGAAFHSAYLRGHVNLPSNIRNGKQMFLDSNIESIAICEGLEEGTSMFENCGSLINPPRLPASLKNASTMFKYCIKLERCPDFSHCTNLKYLWNTFEKCTSIKNVMENLPPNLISMNHVFFNAYQVSGRFPKIPDSVTYMSSAFSNCINIGGEITLPPNIDFNSVDKCVIGTSVTSVKIYSSSPLAAHTDEEIRNKIGIGYKNIPLTRI